mgnify:CR=1 FL=1
MLTFTEIFNMRNHIKIIHKEDPHKCGLCQQLFKTHKDIKEHQKLVHNGKMVLTKRDKKHYYD